MEEASLSPVHWSGAPTSQHFSSWCQQKLILCLRSPCGALSLLQSQASCEDPSSWGGARSWRIRVYIPGPELPIPAPVPQHGTSPWTMPKSKRSQSFCSVPREEATLPAYASRGSLALKDLLKVMGYSETRCYFSADVGGQCIRLFVPWERVRMLGDCYWHQDGPAPHWELGLRFVQDCCSPWLEPLLPRNKATHGDVQPFSTPRVTHRGLSKPGTAFPDPCGNLPARPVEKAANP